MSQDFFDRLDAVERAENVSDKTKVEFRSIVRSLPLDENPRPFYVGCSNDGEVNLVWKNSSQRVEAALWGDGIYSIYAHNMIDGNTLKFYEDDFMDFESFKLALFKYLRENFKNGD
jgi:hypothetical protein